MSHSIIKIFFIIFLIQLNIFECNASSIKNCEESKIIDDEEVCVKCKDKHFPFYNNLYCLPCDDEYYGQIGCGGNCDSSKFQQDRLVYCNANQCKKDYFYLNGICFNCTNRSPGCKKCNVSEINVNGQKDYSYFCTECISNKYKLNKEFGICKKCSMNGCKKCHYNDSFDKECEECEVGYFLTSNRTCEKCKLQYTYNSYCIICSENENDSGICYCYGNNYDYVLNYNNTCSFCGDYCVHCILQNNNNPYCISCKDGYYLSEDNKCMSCLENCESCIIENNKTMCVKCSLGFALSEDNQCLEIPDFCSTYRYENKKFICTSCKDGEVLTPDYKCLKCPDSCENCFIDSKNQTKCTSCKSNYILSSYGICEPCGEGCIECNINEKNETSCILCKDKYPFNINGSCISCGDKNIVGDLGDGCEQCGYNNITKTYECYKCRDNKNYAYIKDNVKKNFQCLDNENNPIDKNLSGCLVGNYTKENIYECFLCKEGFTYIKNNKICKKPEEINLNEDCLEASNIGDMTNPRYSCNKCKSSSVKITKPNNESNCFFRNVWEDLYNDYNIDYGDLFYCLEGIIDEDFFMCTKCVPNSKLIDDYRCECNSDSFSENYYFYYNYNYCYKCNDKSMGIPGCNSAKGCEYYDDYDYPYKPLKCNECENNYFKNYEGKCIPCFNEIDFCDKCSDSNENKICDKCIEDFSYNEEENKCELNCEENPQVSPGCIICKEKYKSEKKCHACKPDYFKTKNDSCIYCRNEKYGGPSCNKCQYEKDQNGNGLGNIICADCTGKDKVLNSKGKCYSCKLDLFEECDHCQFIKEGSSEKLVCTLCKPGYYLDSNGNCISYMNYIEKIDNCEEMIFQIGSIPFYYYYLDNGKEEVYYKKYNYYENSLFNDNNFINFINNNIKNINSKIKGNCNNCKDGYYEDLNGNCFKPKLENCNIISIVKNEKLYLPCWSLCSNNGFPFISFKLNKTGFEDLQLDIDDIIPMYNNIDILNKLELKSVQMCFDNTGKDEQSQKLKNCNKVLYVEKNSQYICIQCSEGFILDNETHLCTNPDPIRETLHCEYENIGTKEKPIYNCIKCDNFIQNYYDQDNDNYQEYILVKVENINICVPKSKYIKGLENCLEAEANTTFIKTKFNCKICEKDYLPYYSKFYERYICQYIYNDIKRSQRINLTQFQDIENITSTNGNCPNTFFTPDGKYCYECSNKNIGMEGCSGKCSFSLEREDIIKCHGNCKEGYLEISEGVCELCDKVNKGCYSCHYDINYPEDYFGIKGKRRFVCDACSADYFKNEEVCVHCSEIVSNCEKCDNEYKCKQCKSGYYLTEDNKCAFCGDLDHALIGNNKCLECDDITKGGIEGCQYCETNNNKIICRLCKEGFILLSNNYTCLNISKNKDLVKFKKCNELTLDNNNILHCSRCKNEYLTLLKAKDEDNCLNIFSVNNPNDFSTSYDGALSTYFENNQDMQYLYYYYYRDYYYSLYRLIEPCQEAVNLGTNENPLYSCIKCYNLFEYDKINYNKYTLIAEEKTNLSFCAREDILLENCIEANLQVNKTSIKFSCTKCKKDNILVYNDTEKIYECKSDSVSPSTCMVKNCKQCKSDNNAFCDICISSSDYLVNKLTGSCVKKYEKEPIITWKDIYGFNLYGMKEINGRKIYGPKLTLRGFTSDKVNQGHAFLLYFTFKLSQSRILRNLEEKTITLDAICEIIKGVEEAKNNINIVDYECIAENRDNYQLYELINIEEENPNNSNLKILVNQKALNRINDYPSFGLEDIEKTLLFNIKGENITYNNFIFDIKLSGQINKESDNDRIVKSLRMLNSQDLKSDCVFEINNKTKGYLNCKLNVENYKNENNFSFQDLNITNEKKNIELVDLYKISLKKIDNNETETSIPIGKAKESKKKVKAYVIVLCVLAGVIALGGIIALVYIFVIRKKNKGDKKANDITPRSIADVNNLNNLSQTTENINN